MKKFILFLFLACSINMFAQDVIVKRDGSTILSKVLEVGTSEVKYKKFSNQTGPTYTIPVSVLLSINYANGEKDDFGNTSTQGRNKGSVAPDVAQSGVSQGLIKKPADDNNAEIIARHNIIHPNISGKPASEKAAKECIVKYGVASSSIMSNEDAEISFVRKVEWGNYEKLLYFINIKNKTDKVMYVDRGNCFKVYSDGYSYCYYDASTQTTVNQGGSSGGSVNLGSVAGALGIGGLLGQVAGGVNVGGSSSGSITTSYATQRFLAIPPHGSKYLTEYVWIGEGKRRTCVEEPEYLWPYREHDKELVLRRGDIKKRQTKTFSEDEIPWKREFYITYSTDDNFNTYSVLYAKLYVQEVIGEGSGDVWNSYCIKLHKKQRWFLNENTMVRGIRLYKK